MRRAEYVESAVDIDLVRGHRIVDGTGYGGYRGFMKYHRSAANQRSNFVVIANVGDLQVDGAPDFLQIRFVPGQEIVNRHDSARAFFEQAAHDCRPDESRSSGNNVMAHESPVYDDPDVIRAQ